MSNKLNVHYLQYLKIRIFSQMREDIKLPCEQRFLSCMSFNVYEVVCVACLSHSWFVLRQTSYTNYFKLCSMSDVLLTFFRRVTERQTSYTNNFKLCSMSDVLLMFFRRLTERQTSYMNYFKLCSMSDVLLTFFRRLTEQQTSYTNYFKLCSISDVFLTFFRRLTEQQTSYTNYFKLCSMSDVLLTFFKKVTERQTSYMNYFKLCSMSDVLIYLRFSGDWQSPSKPRIFAKHQCHVGSFQVQQISDCKGSIEHQKAYNPRVYVRAQLYLAYPSLKTLISSRRSFTRYCAQLLRMQFLLLRCTLMVIS